MIVLKTPFEISQIKYSCKMVAEFLNMCNEYVKPGIVTWELDELATKYCVDNKVIPAFKNYKGFPYAVCVSVNDEVVHGFPGSYVLKKGDIVTVDFGINRNGYFGDAAITIPIGEVTIEIKKLLKVTKECLRESIKKAVKGNKVTDISKTIETIAHKHSFDVSHNFTGHGIGFQLHEAPKIPCYLDTNYKDMLKVGMVVAIEPILFNKKCPIQREANKWTVVSMDGSSSAHFEHTLAITENGPEILTL